MKKKRKRNWVRNLRAMPALADGPAGRGVALPALQGHCRGHAAASQVFYFNPLNVLCASINMRPRHGGGGGSARKPLLYSFARHAPPHHAPPRHACPDGSLFIFGPCPAVPGVRALSRSREYRAPGSRTEPYRLPRSTGLHRVLRSGASRGAVTSHSPLDSDKAT